MAYYLRALVREWRQHPPSALVAYSRERGVPLRLEAGEGAELAEPDWREAALLAENLEQPIVVEVTQADDALLQEEIEEFREQVESAGGSENATEKVLSHLDGTTAIVAVQVPAAGGERALDAAGTIISYYAEQPGTMIQVDDEGFYDGARLILATQ